MEKKKQNIILIGMPGCGKTSIGKRLARRLSMDFIDIDEAIEEKTQLEIAEIFEKGEDYFRKIESQYIEELSKVSASIISTGGGVVTNPLNMDILRENGIIIFINRPLENIIQDINTENRPLLKDGKEKIIKLYEDRITLYNKYKDYEIINDGKYEEVLEKISDCIKYMVQ